MPYVTLKNGNRIEALDEFTGESKAFEFDTENKKVLADFGDGSAAEEIGGMTPEQSEELNQAVDDIAQLKIDVARAESKADIAGEVANSKLDNSMHSHTEGTVPVADENGQLVDNYITNDNIATSAGIESSKLAFTSAQTSVLTSGIDATKVAQIQQNSDDINLVDAKAAHADAEAERIGKLIPSEATIANKLADKNFVNSTVATNTANFIGTFNSVAELEAYSGTVTNNDYAFVISGSGANTVYNRYKYTDATTPASWVFEYALNNSSFTAAQWATINSGATAGTVTQVETNRTNIVANSNSIATLNASASTQGSVANKIATALPNAGDGDTIDANSSGKLEAIGLLNANGGAPIKVWEGSESAWENGETNDWFGWSNNNVSSQLDEDRFPSSMSTGYSQMAYGTSRLLCMTEGSVCYSDDKGLTWVVGTNAPNNRVADIVFHKGNFVTSDYDCRVYTREELSDTWITRGYVVASGYHFAGKERIVATSNKLFCIIYDSNTIGLFESSDIGATWSEVVSNVVDNALGSAATNRINMASNGSTVIITAGNQSIYSTDDGVTWQQGGQIDATATGWVIYPLNNGTFVVSNQKTIKYTEDNGVTWKSGASFTGSNSVTVLKDLGGIIIVSDGNSFYSGNYSLASWTWIYSMPNVYMLCRNPAIMDNKLIGCIENTRYMLTLANVTSVIYTDSTTVTSSSTVYSAPNVASSDYSINYKSGNTLNVYDSVKQVTVNFNRDSQLDQATTSSIGDIHPDWLCNIENVGVKFGNRLIADASGSLVVDQVYDATSVNAQSGVAIAGAGFASASSLATVATSGDYDDLSNKPTIPTVDQSYSASSTNAQSGVAVAQAVAAVGSSKSDCFVRTMTYQLSNWTDTTDAGLSATYPKQATNTIELLSVPYKASNKVSAYVSFSGANAISGKYAPVATVTGVNTNPNQGAQITIYATEIPSTQPTIDVTIFVEYGA